ncbi:uncharacterized protein LOC129067841 [Pteronotus mesoamericanus]|uniref:uncharacterized protein LOC129067841 n=1 Tax=Pteronotus mesoamericanus TaxID=1884717 RepID=UPI0023ECB74E|nr:uncharacterized protein LOC129067841 [Pteronotus parnellii mesoamericanus]
MVQAFMGTVDVLLYDCDNNEVMAVNDKLKGTKTLEDMKHTLKDMGDLMREKLLDIKAETKRAPPTLQVGLMCWCNASGSCSGSSGFGFGGQRFPVFDSASGKYIADNSGDKGMKENLEQDKEVTIAFQVTFLGNCKEWLTALVDRERELETRVLFLVLLSLLSIFFISPLYFWKSFNATSNQLLRRLLYCLPHVLPPLCHSKRDWQHQPWPRPRPCHPQFQPRQPPPQPQLSPRP